MVWYGQKNTSDKWQVADVGIAETLKVLAGHHYHQWLDEGDNLDLWHKHEKGLNAMQR